MHEDANRRHADAERMHTDAERAYDDHDLLIELKSGQITLSAQIADLAKQHNEVIHRLFIGNGSLPITKEIKDLQDKSIVKERLLKWIMSMTLILLLLHAPEVLKYLHL